MIHYGPLSANAPNITTSSSPPATSSPDSLNTQPTALTRMRTRYIGSPLHRVTSCSSTMNLLELPLEIVHQILTVLPHIDLASCQLVNSELNDIIRNSLHLQYLIALALAQAEDNPCSTASIARKLQDVKQSEAAWCSFRPQFVVSLPVRHRTSGIYDLSGGTYLLGNADKKVLQYLRLPKQLGDPLDWYQVAVPHGKTIVDMGFCVFEHDLIAIVTTSPRLSLREEHDINMLLFEYSTGKPHPRAKSPCIFVMSSESPRPSLMCEIVGDHLVLILNFSDRHHPADRVFIWDWSNNVLKSSFSAPYLTYSGLLFLDQDLILLPNSSSATFDVFRIPTDQVAHPLTPILSLSFPSLAPGVQVDRITCRAEPNPIPDISRLDKKRRAQERANAGMDETDPFAPARGFLASADDALCIFQMRFTSDPVLVIQGGANVHLEIGSSYTFLIHRRSFLDLVRKHCISTSPNYDGCILDPAPRVPWPSWGPPVSRWFDADSTPTRWITTSAGQRCAMIQEVPGRVESLITILDFNPENVKKIKAKMRERLRAAVVFSNDWVSEDLLPSYADLLAEQGPSSSPFEDSLMEEEEFSDSQDDAEDDDDYYDDSDSSAHHHHHQRQQQNNTNNVPAGSYTTNTNDPRHPGLGVRYRVYDTPVSQHSLRSPNSTFAEPVEGHLPYVVYISERHYNYDGVLLDEERIIGIKTDAIDRISEVDIMYFG